MRKFAKAAAIAAAVMTATITALNAAELDNGVREGQALVTNLGADASAVTYWVSRSDGWHVVTTVDTVINRDGNAEKHAVVRFSSLLLPGQSQQISVPLARGEQQQVLRIRRIADRIEVERVAAPGA